MKVEEMIQQLEHMSSISYEKLIKAIVTFDTGIKDENVLDQLYDDFIHDGEGSLFSMWFHVKQLEGRDHE